MSLVTVRSLGIRSQSFPKIPAATFTYSPTAPAPDPHHLHLSILIPLARSHLHPHPRRLPALLNRRPRQHSVLHRTNRPHSRHHTKRPALLVPELLLSRQRCSRPSDVPTRRSFRSQIRLYGRVGLDGNMVSYHGVYG